MTILMPLNGFFIVHKPLGPSSASVSNHLKWSLKQAGYPKGIKIGHGGTLDPLASGVLPIGVGKATKHLQALLDGPKTYTFTVQFGTATTTGDTAGTVTSTSPNRPSPTQIEQSLAQFRGLITQIPPAFSALKVGGKRAYELARAGQAVQLAPRQVTIHSLEIIDSTPNSATFKAAVSKGTYIRTLAEDIAQAVDTVGHTTILTRTQHGPFTLEQAVLPEILDNALKSGDITAYLHPLDASPAPGLNTKDDD